MFNQCADVSSEPERRCVSVFPTSWRTAPSPRCWRTTPPPNAGSHSWWKTCRKAKSPTPGASHSLHSDRAGRHRGHGLTVKDLGFPQDGAATVVREQEEMEEVLLAFRKRSCSEDVLKPGQSLCRRPLVCFGFDRKLLYFFSKLQNKIIITWEYLIFNKQHFKTQLQTETFTENELLRN